VIGEQMLGFLRLFGVLSNIIFKPHYPMVCQGWPFFVGSRNYRKFAYRRVIIHESIC
jgi:hypothetical protein